MGVLLNEDADREHMKKVALGHADGETHEGIGAFTRELKIRYEAPVRTPGVAIVRAEFLKKEGRRTWIKAVVSQWSGGEDGRDELVCAVGEGLFVEPRTGKL